MYPITWIKALLSLVKSWNLVSSSKQFSRLKFTRVRYHGIMHIFYQIILKMGHNICGIMHIFTITSEGFNPNWHEGWYFYLLVIFGWDFSSRSAHQTPNFMNPEFQFPQFKVLQSFLMYFGIDLKLLSCQYLLFVGLMGKTIIS